MEVSGEGVEEELNSSFLEGENLEEMEFIIDQHDDRRTVIIFKSRAKADKVERANEELGIRCSYLDIVKLVGVKIPSELQKILDQFSEYLRIFWGK